MKYGRLAACFRIKDGNNFIVIQPYRKAEGKNEQDCPNLHLMDTLYVTGSQVIIQSVSVVHNCKLSCKLINSTSKIERETVVRSTKYLSVVHDPTHNSFCLNMYCLSSQDFKQIIYLLTTSFTFRVIVSLSVCATYHTPCLHQLFNRKTLYTTYNL